MVLKNCNVALFTKFLILFMTIITLKLVYDYLTQLSSPFDNIRVDLKKNSNKSFNSEHGIIRKQINGLKNMSLRAFDMSLPLKPNEYYDDILCKKSAKFFVTTTLCIYDLNANSVVSSDILHHGVWEPNLLEVFTDFIYENPNILVFDLGASIGQFTLFAAKMGRKVIAVEPFFDNILRIHKAASLESLSDRITLIANALSDKRNEVMLLSQLNENGTNINEQSLIVKRNKMINRDELKRNKNTVETILLDDIIEHIPTKNNKKDFTEAILKIDIEGFEPFVFKNAQKLFKKLKIKLVIMKWGNLGNDLFLRSHVEDMLTFFYDNNYNAYQQVSSLIFWKKFSLLQRKDFEKWPSDVFWVKP